MPERVFRFAIASFVLLFAAIGVVTLLTDEGPRPGADRVIAIAIMATTIPVGLAVSRYHLGAVWLSGSTRTHYAPILFVLYADLGLTGVLATFSSPKAALFGTALFAVTGMYAAHFLRPPRYLAAHVAFSSIVIVAFAVVAVHLGHYDIFGTIARAGVQLFVVNGCVVLQSIYTERVRQAIMTNHRHATTDPLTGVANRRAFLQRTRHILAAGPQGVVLLMIDIDDFKSINDARGHHHGDELLTCLADALVAAVGPDAVVARLGGDEFAVAVAAPETRIPELAQTLRSAALANAGVEISIGAAHATASQETSARALSELQVAADADLYNSKNGRQIATELSPTAGRDPQTGTRFSSG